MKILGIDPGLQKTGWGIITIEGNKLGFVACGLIRTNAKLPLFMRLLTLQEGIERAVRLHAPDQAAIEETFMNNNAQSALKLGLARGALILSAAATGLSVAEYAANLVKKSIVGAGHADKNQMGMMVSTLLPKAGKVSEDEADALAVAICHAHHAQSMARTLSAVQKPDIRYNTR